MYEGVHISVPEQHLTFFLLRAPRASTQTTLCVYSIFCVFVLRNEQSTIIDEDENCLFQSFLERKPQCLLIMLVYIQRKAGMTSTSTKGIKPLFSAEHK